MKIEKLVFFDDGTPIGTICNKINELIDAFNLTEYNRSEQMARIIKRLCKLEKEAGGAIGCLDRANENMQKLLDSINDGSLGIKEEKDNDILSCPFCCCIGKVSFNKQRQSEQYNVLCPDVNCKVNPITNYFETKEEAIDAWNQRE